MGSEMTRAIAQLMRRRNCCGLLGLMLWCEGGRGGLTLVRDMLDANIVDVCVGIV